MAVSTLFHGLETVSFGGFITSTSTKVNDQLTNYAHLRTGTWLMIMKTPYTTNTSNGGNFLANLNAEVDNSQYLIGQAVQLKLSYGMAQLLIRVDQPMDVCMVTAMSYNTWRWDANYLNRGGMVAIRVSD